MAATSESCGRSRTASGPTDEIGVFEMTGGGLSEVANPSALFLTAHEDATPGVAVFAGMEGTRPLLVEIQALVAPTSLGTPRRAVVGWDTSRLAMVVAVLEAHAGLKLGQHDIYLTIAGGLRVSEPAADLAAAAALVSSLSGQSLSPNAVYFGEVGLSGAVRPVAHAAARLKEAAKLGFTQAIAPRATQAAAETGGEPLATTSCDHIGALVAEIANPAKRAAGPPRPWQTGRAPQASCGHLTRLPAAPAVEPQRFPSLFQ